MNILGTLLTWLLAYWLDCAVVVFTLLVLAVMIRNGRADTVKKIVLYLVVQAQKELGSGTGPLKYAIVIAALYERLPFVLRIVFTRTDIDNFINEAVTYLKNLLAEPGTNLLSADQEAAAYKVTQSK